MDNSDACVQGIGAFAAEINTICRRDDAPFEIRVQVLETLHRLTRLIQLTEAERRPVPHGYIARQLYADPAG